MGELKPGLVLTSENNKKYTITKYIDSGTQGDVYEISEAGKKLALKWYPNFKEETKEKFLLLKNNWPKTKDEKKDERFVWAEDIISTKDGVGYTMKYIDMEKYNNVHWIRDDLYNTKQSIKTSILCRICMNIAEAFHNLHSMGYCYKDISHNNMVMNINNGDVLIMDIDNVVVNEEKGEVDGTGYFRSPEIVLGLKTANTDADRFSLAVWFFYLLVGHHPFDGRLRYDYEQAHGNRLDDEGFKKNYGSGALYIFHPTDKRNNIEKINAKFDAIKTRWENILPNELKEKFEKTFVRGLPVGMATERTNDLEWATLFNDLSRKIISCKCGSDFFYGSTTCIKCLNSLMQSIIKLSIMERHQALDRIIDIKNGDILSGRQISALLNQYDPFLKIVFNPTINAYGMENLSSLIWRYKDPIMQQSEPVQPGDVIQLKKERIIAFIPESLQIEVL
ncbi:MAG: hypothetical protein FWG98_02415 [Candidatus Cloacimonetes bacterium]|nr:hypothetical protein [Candidatus Cloacimonadota bacterium]